MTSGRDRQWDEGKLADFTRPLKAVLENATSEDDRLRARRIIVEAAMKLKDVDPEYCEAIIESISDHAAREAKKQKDVRLGEGLNQDGGLPTNSEPGIKFDSSKPDMRLIPPLAELEMAKVLTFGAEKYAPDNWKKVEPERYISAAMRHINAIRQGELVDSESGCHHAAHLMCCAAFMVELMKPSVSFTISLSDMEKDPSMGPDSEIGKAVTKAITGSKGPELTPNKGSKIPADALDVALDRSRH